ncbi:MAG TPA: DUF1415 domain-containing protein [Burkholderiaceae bacterium]|nr:DUF1415 domain-containing protein [Burkholderiaceae bacterium]
MPNSTPPALPPSIGHSDDIIQAATVRWLERAVIGLNLCPFAKSVHVKGQVRYVVSPHSSADKLLAQLETELSTLAATDAQAVDTTLLICPHALQDFTAFNDFLTLADITLGALGLRGVLQIASFHPNYQFDGNAAEAIENYTNRAPYPILHLLREASIDRAVAAVPDAADIYERNEATMRALGHAGWKKLWNPPS